MTADQKASTTIYKYLQKHKTLRCADAREFQADPVMLEATLPGSYDASDLSNILRETFEHA